MRTIDTLVARFGSLLAVAVVALVLVFGMASYAGAQTATALEFDHTSADRAETQSYTYAVFAKGSTSPVVGPLSVPKDATVLVAGETYRIVFPRLLAGEYEATIVACAGLACSATAGTGPFPLPPPPVRNVKGKAVVQ